MGQSNSNKNKESQIPKPLIDLYFKQIDAYKLDIEKQPEVERSNIKIALQNKTFSSCSDRKHINYKAFKDITWDVFFQHSFCEI
ncbi:MAG: hypothetical protein MJ252_15125, partial [archaeon]|nr:hypothetical protein [archaeon]